jgi:hypothetical protein
MIRLFFFPSIIMKLSIRVFKKSLMNNNNQVNIKERDDNDGYS